MEPDICDISKWQIKRDYETAEVSSDKLNVNERERALTNITGKATP